MNANRLLPASLARLVRNLSLSLLLNLNAAPLHAQRPQQPIARPAGGPLDVANLQIRLSEPDSTERQLVITAARTSLEFRSRHWQGTEARLRALLEAAVIASPTLNDVPLAPESLESLSLIARPTAQLAAACIDEAERLQQIAGSSQQPMDAATPSTDPEAALAREAAATRDVLLRISVQLRELEAGFARLSPPRPTLSATDR
jgi:hypothetical protein